jgi:hypothetical protein
VIRVLNAFGGPGLIQEYFGPASGGSGSLIVLGAQYDLSIGKLTRYPEPYSGYAPDVFLSFFGMSAMVSSDDQLYDGVTKFKAGGEVTYSALSWLALSGRYDHVAPNDDDETQSFSIISPRVILRTDFQAQDQVALQYSRYLYGSGVMPNSGYPLMPQPGLKPDEDVISMTATMWW